MEENTRDFMVRRQEFDKVSYISKYDFVFMHSIKHLYNQVFNTGSLNRTHSTLCHLLLT